MSGSFGVQGSEVVILSSACCSQGALESVAFLRSGNTAHLLGLRVANMRPSIPRPDKQQMPLALISFVFLIYSDNDGVSVTYPG